MISPAFADINGPSNPSSVADVSGVGTRVWNTPANISTVGTPYSNVTLGLGETSHYIQASTYGMSIPAGATINGITVQINRRGSANTLWLWVRDNIVRLVKWWVITGSNKAVTGSTWWTTFSTVNYGWTSDLWWTTWTPDDINAANFGVVFSVTTNALLSRTATLDSLSISVDYTPDTTAPIISEVTPITTPSDDTTPSYTFTTDEAGTLTYGGSCSSVTTVASVGPNTVTFNTLADGTYTDCTLTVTDSASNVSNTLSIDAFTIDASAPTLTLPENITEEATSPIGNIVTFSTTATDTSPVNPTVTCIPASGSTFPIGMTTVLCSATDTVWNIADDTFSVAIVDTTDPELTTPGTLTLEATGMTTPSTLIGATATDIVDLSPSITYDPATLPLGDTTVTVTATDDEGNAVSSPTIVTVVDTTDPVITLIGNNPYDLYINSTFTDPGFQALDIVDGDITGGVIVDGGDFDTGTLWAHTITYSIEDAQGNSTSVTRTVNIVNNIKPIIYRLGLSPFTAERLASYVDAGATAIDRDGSDITSSIVVSGWDYNTISVGSYEIYYNVVGAELGELTGTSIADQAKRIVNVVDTTAPTATVSYSTTEPTNTSVIATITPSEDITVTNNGGLLTYTFTDNGSFTFHFIDGSGNMGSVEASVDTIDLIDPEIVQIEEDVYSILSTAPDTIEILFDSELQDNLDHTPSESDFIVYDDVDDSWDYNEGDTIYDIATVSYSDTTDIVTITVTNPLQSGDTPRLFITTIATSLIDMAGNYYNDQNPADYPILDRVAPHITLSGADFISLTRGSSYTDAGATCVDVVDEACIVITSGSVDINTIGTYILTYSATDSSGNDAINVIRTVVISAPVSSGGSVIHPQFLNNPPPLTLPNTPPSPSPTTPWSDAFVGLDYPQPANPSPIPDNTPPPRQTNSNTSHTPPTDTTPRPTNSSTTNTPTTTTKNNWTEQNTSPISDTSDTPETSDTPVVPPALEEITDTETASASADIGGGQPAEEHTSAIAWILLGLIALLNAWWFFATQWRSKGN
jgi:Domain of unknown function (DUF5011)/HYR domain